MMGAPSRASVEEKVKPAALHGLRNQAPGKSNYHVSLSEADRLRFLVEVGFSEVRSKATGWPWGRGGDSSLSNAAP